MTSVAQILYQRTATMIKSGGKRNPAKPDRGGDTELWRRRIVSPCPSPSSANANATVPLRARVRLQEGRTAAPSAAIIDSASMRLRPATPSLGWPSDRPATCDASSD